MPKNKQITMVKLTDEEIVKDGFKALYAAASPSADYDKLISECVKYIDKDSITHITEKPLTDEECQERGWYKDIGYLDYELEETKYLQIIEDKIKEHNLDEYKALLFKNTMIHTHGPKMV